MINISNSSSIPVEKLVPGDHIYVLDGNSIFSTARHAIFVGYSGCIYWVIYVNDEDGKVVQTSICQFLRGRPLRRAQYGVTIFDQVLSGGQFCFREESSDKQTVISRALECVDSHSGGETNPWVSKDCETFARYCKTGKIVGLELEYASQNKRVIRRNSAAAASLVGASVGVLVAGPVGGLVGSLLGAGIAIPSVTIFV